MYLRAGKMPLLVGIGLVEVAGLNVEEVEAKEMILSAPVEATISGLPMPRYGQKFLVASTRTEKLPACYLVETFPARFSSRAELRYRSSLQAIY